VLYRLILSRTLTIFRFRDRNPRIRTRTQAYLNEHKKEEVKKYKLAQKTLTHFPYANAEERYIINRICSLKWNRIKQVMGQLPNSNPRVIFKTNQYGTNAPQSTTRLTTRGTIRANGKRYNSLLICHTPAAPISYFHHRLRAHSHLGGKAKIRKAESQSELALVISSV